MDRYTLSAYIRCYKDPKLVLKCASHLKWADEIFVADNSDDSSVKDVIHLIDHPNVSYFNTDIVDFRHRLNSLKDKLSGDFILMVDTDEYYTEASAKEILDVLSDKGNIKEGYIVPSESYAFGEYLAKGANQLRLMMKDKFYFAFTSIHEMPKVKGDIGRLNNGYDHYNSPTFFTIANKPFLYANDDARVLTLDQLQSKRTDTYSSFQLKKHYFKLLVRILWRSKGFFFSRKVRFVDMWLQYRDVLVFISNDTAPTDEIRTREGKIY